MTRTEDQENLICNGSTMGILERQGSLEERAQEQIACLWVYQANDAGTIYFHFVC